MARSFSRASIIGSRNTRFSNTKDDLNLNVDLEAADGGANLVEASAFSENGVSNDASASAETDANVGILFSSPGSTAPSPVIRSSRGGNIRVRGATGIFATAARESTTFTQTNGTADASANFTGPTGGIINTASIINDDGGGEDSPAPDIKIAGTGVIDVEMINVADAFAAGEQEASAQADMGDGFFGIANTGIEINGGAPNTVAGDDPESQVLANVDAGIFTEAVSTFGDATADSGSRSDTTEVAGIFNGLVTRNQGEGLAPLNLVDPPQETLRIGFASSGLVDASVDLQMGSEAISQNGDASANNELELAAGIFNADNSRRLSSTFLGTNPADPSGAPILFEAETIDVATDLLIDIDGPLSIVEGDAAVLSDATAISDTGRALATIDNELIGGIVDQRTLDGDNPSGTRIQFGSSGTVRANAFANNTAFAESVGETGDSSFAKAEIDNDEVIGLAMDVVADGSLSIEATATSIQNATAIGGNFDGGSDPVADVATNDEVAGVINSDISTLGNLQGISIAGELIGNATATSDQGSGGTNAFAGDDSEVFGIAGSDLDVLGGLQSDGGVAADLDITATSDLSATATSATDNVTAIVGGGGSGLTVGEDAAIVTGISNTDISVFGGGPDQGSINVAITGDADAEAITGTGSANAQAAMVATGVEGSDIFLRGDTAGDPLDGLNVTVGLGGSVVAQGADASGSLTLVGEGIALGEDTIEIDRNGSVTAATTISDPSLTVTSTDGADVDASGGLFAGGITSAFGDITLGDNGSIVGAGIIEDAIVAASTGGDGDADAEFDFGAAGLASFTGEDSFTAGRTSGNVDGQAIASGTVSADSVNGDAFADTFGTLIGIGGLDITAGLLTPDNAVVGISEGSFNTTATASGTGDAIADSDFEAVGIRGGNIFEQIGRNSLRVNGNITARASLINTVVADAQGSGIADADSIGRVVGIENMDISTTGPSTIEVQAGGVFTATSFGGSVPV